MRTLTRIVVFLVILIITAVIGLYIFIGTGGKRLAQEKLSQAFRRPVGIENIRFTFPLGLRLTNLKVEGALHARDVRVQLGMPIFLNNELFLARVRLVEPFVIVNRDKEGRFVWGKSQVLTGNEGYLVRADTPAQPEAVAAEVQQTSDLPRVEGVFVDFLEVENGKVEFEDFRFESPENASLQLNILDVNLKGRSISYPLKPVKTKFDLTARIKSDRVPFSGSRVESRGWVNFIERDMDGKIEIIEPDGAVGLSANLVSEDNDMAVNGHLKFNPKDAAQAVATPEGTDFLGGEWFGQMLSASSLMAGWDFSFNTKMDDFRVDALAFAGEIEIEGISFKASGGIKNDIKNIGKQFEAFGKKFYEENIKQPETPPQATEAEEAKEPVPTE